MMMEIDLQLSELFHERERERDEDPLMSSSSSSSWAVTGGDLSSN